MFTRMFWLRSIERAGKTAAQAAILVLGAGQLNALAVDWQNLAGFAAGGAVLSLLTSIASIGIGDRGTPSLVKETS